MMKNLNPWQAIAALGIVSAMVVVLIVTGHESSLAIAAKAVGLALGGGVLALLNVAKSGGSPQ